MACAAVVVIAGVTTWALQHYRLLDRGKATPLSVDDARERYRESTSASTVLLPTTTAAAPVVAAATTPAVEETTTTAPPAAAELPPLGVYTYTTTGHDAVDALTGDHHDYPATTTITVTAGACGVTQRWDILVERWEQWDRCIDGTAIRQPGRVTFDTFFGQTQTDTYVCTGDSRPVDAPAGTTWTQSCAQGDVVEIHHGQVVGVEQLTVGTSPVDTLHVSVSTEYAMSTDSQVIDTWYQVGTDLVVKQTAQAATTNSTPVGDVHYTETYEIDLNSLTPLT